MPVKKTKICLVVDVRGWAFENIALKIRDKLKHNYDVDIVYMGDQKSGSEMFLLLFMKSKPYDLVHFFWRGALGKLFDSQTVAKAAAMLDRDDTEEFLHNIATAIKTTWICDHLYLEKPIEAIWMRQVLAYADRYAVSSQILSSIYSQFPNCPSPNTVISDGVDLSMFTPSSQGNKTRDTKALKIGWAGNSSWGAQGTDHKGLVSVIEPAIEQLQKEGYTVIGHFCDRQECWTAHEDMPAYYHSIDIYVCASVSEGTPNPILEAMACGLPVLSTDVGIVGEAFGPLQQEFIVIDRHSPEFINKLRKLVESPALRKQLAEENIHTIQNWAWPDRIAQWEDFIVNALNVNRNNGSIEKQLATLKESISLAQLKYSLASRLNRQGRNDPKRICLAMMVCNESKIIRRCLDSVARHIDQYFILDTGSIDDTVKIIQQSIGHLPGTVEITEFTSFDDLRSRLFIGASIDADFVLFVDADETLQSISATWRLDDGFDVGRIEVAMSSHSVVQPRLVSSNAQLSCIGAYSESVIVQSHMQQRFLDNVRFQHHADGNRHTDRTSLEGEKNYLLEQLASSPCAPIYLNLARVYLRLNEADIARDMLEQCCKLEAQDESAWQAHYLLGLLLESSKFAISNAEHHYRLAFELAPDRVEALFRLIKIRINNKEFETAQSLAKIAAEIEIPVHSDYFERRLYDNEIPACLALLASKLDTPEAGSKLASDKILEPAAESESFNRRKPKHSRESLATLVQQGGPAPKLTIGMATYDDYDGVYFSVMAISLYHPEVLNDIELIVIDNNPGGKCSNALIALCETLPFARYIAVGEIRGTAVRDSIFVHARGVSVLCVDAHVMLFPNALKRLIDYFDDHSTSMDLYQGPLIREDKLNAAYCMSEVWNKGMLGVWKNDPKLLNPESAPFEVQMQGLGLFACRKAAWPKFNPRFSGFGGEEGYIHEKFRQRGGKTMCLPFLQWIHRFERPMGAHYPNVWEDRIRNYLIGHDELGLDTKVLEQHFASHLGFQAMANARKNFDDERARTIYQFDAIFCIKHNHTAYCTKMLERQLKRLGIAHRIQSIEIVKESESPLNNRLATQANIVQRAQLYGYERIFIFDERSLFHQQTDRILTSALSELLNQDWDICYFDTGIHNTRFSSVSESGQLARIEQSDGLIQSDNCGYVIAINNSGYSKFIGSIGITEQQSVSSEDISMFSATPMLATQFDFLENIENSIWFIDHEQR